jgi:uncharacterized protein (TIGR03000 family)
MYSIVLMMALSSGAEAPAGVDHGHAAYRHGGHGCYGCSGCSGCYGCHGCYGYGCNGCYGCNGGRHHRHHHRGHGCNGCYSYGCHGCYGYGCQGCYGGCQGCYGYGCQGCYGYGCHGYDGHGAPAGGEKKGEQLKTSPKVTGMAAPATVIVSLPAETKLAIDGAPTTSTSERRVFISPSLEPGKTYHYTLTGELVREGRTMTSTKQVEVRAGEQTQVNLDFSETVAQR